MTLWTIPADQPFLEALVAGLFDRVGRDPLALTHAQIILPTRRAVRALREAFLRAADGALMLLPRMAALGDLDADDLDLALPRDAALDLPPAISPLRRELLLARLIRRQRQEMLPGQALALAGDLATLIDQVHTERTSFDRLVDLVPADLADHWQLTVRFLEIVSHFWPEVLAAEGVIDPADRRNRLIAAQIDAWARLPPAGMIVAAGLETAIPAVTDLVEAILALPAGAVVLSGLDREADATIWGAVETDPTHPQHAFARLLARLTIERDAVRPWRDVPRRPHAAARAALVREIMRPAAVSDHWRGLSPLPPGATDGMARIDLAGAQEEAATIALLLRDRLETPGATAILVTPDRALARRVASEMRRWDVEIDDSAGRALGQTAPGAFLRLLAEAVAEHLAPVPLLALLKHPLAACGSEPGAFREQVRSLERHALRGSRPAPGIAGLRLVATDAALLELVERIDAAVGALAAMAAVPAIDFRVMLEAHILAAERLAVTGALSGADRLWAGEAGEALADFIAELGDAARDFGTIDGADYPMLFEAALGGRVVRPVAGRHPRLQILGTLEARLQSADLVVVGGLNEGTWPPLAPHDPWMSRPMRAEFGLGPDDLAIGGAAHDFTMALGAPEIVMTRALRVEGTPTVPSRWLLRLDTVLQALQMRGLPIGGRNYHGFRLYQTLLDHPERVRPTSRPAPRPPVAARPRGLSVTEIELWMRDPYAIYARHILGLRPIDPLDADPGAADRGSFIHQALDAFVRTRAGVPTAAWLDLLTALGRQAFGETMARPAVSTFWWPRFLKIADWMVATEIDLWPGIASSRAEIKGELELAGAEHPFRLKAKADRIDHLAGGGIAIIDYKTGSLPDKKEIEAGYSPQLPLEGLIARHGGFGGPASRQVSELAFWRLSGSASGCEIVRLKGLDGLIDAAGEGLRRLIVRFDDPATPYYAQPLPDYAPRYSDYDHLARVLEWGRGGAE